MSQYDQARAWSDVRVGLIVFAGLLFLVLGIAFAGGDKGLIFKKTSTVKARLADIGGLKKGASVTIGGMIVGKVTDTRFAAGGQGNQIEITMEIRSDMRAKIKADSLPSVRTQGMLGDRYVDISMGSERVEPLPRGSILMGTSATDFDQTLREALKVLNETEKLLKAINERQGTVGQLVYDKEFYANLTAVSNELNDLIKDFKKDPRRYIKFSVF